MLFVPLFIKTLSVEQGGFGMTRTSDRVLELGMLHLGDVLHLKTLFDQEIFNRFLVR